MRQIAYFGDTMNVAARLCEYSKRIGEAVVISAEFEQRADLPIGLSIDNGKSIPVRGKKEAVKVYAVRRVQASEVRRRA
jgi:class 3 adenylate cyclase